MLLECVFVSVCVCCVTVGLDVGLFGSFIVCMLLCGVCEVVFVCVVRLCCAVVSGVCLCVCGVWLCLCV